MADRRMPRPREGSPPWRAAPRGTAKRAGRRGDPPNCAHGDLGLTLENGARMVLRTLELKWEAPAKVCRNVELKWGQ